jgi:hypothetical protein
MPDNSLTLNYITVRLHGPFQSCKWPSHETGALMQRVKRLIAVLIITGWTIFTPVLAMSELDINTDLWSNLSENEVLALRFSGFDSKADTTISDEYLDTDSPSSTEMGYWFEDIPWLGVTSETSLSGTNEVNSETSIEADTDFDPLNSFILFRYHDGPLQPFVGVGPTLLISDFGGKNIDSVHHLFMGFHYTF